MDDNLFEIPQPIRDLAETNIKQAHAVYGLLTDFVSKSIDAWMDAMPASPGARGFKYLQDRAIEIAMENAEVSVYIRQPDQRRTDFPRYRDA